MVLDRKKTLLPLKIDLFAEHVLILVLFQICFDLFCK